MPSPLLLVREANAAERFSRLNPVRRYGVKRTLRLYSKPRDYVILSLLVGCALRRQELATLDIESIQMREGRWVVADLRGKGGRVRTVAIPFWVKQGINAWMIAAKDRGRPPAAAALQERQANELGDWAIWSVVEQCAKEIGIERFGAHDLRRYAEFRIMPNR